MPSYAFISGKIRALENKLPDQIDFDRMIDAPNFEDAFKVLNDTNYSDKLLDISPFQFETILEKDLLELKDLLEKYLPSKHLANFLFMQEDWNNIKVFLKAFYNNGKINTEAISKFGNIPEKELQSFILDENNSLMIPETYKKQIIKIKEALKENVTPEKIDLSSDKAYFEELWNLSKKIKESFIQKLTKRMIDISNARILFRALLLNRNDSFISQCFAENGLISTTELTAAYKDKNFDKAISLFKNQMSLNAATNLLIFGEKQSLKKLERSLDLWLEDLIRDAKYKPLGPETAVEFYQKKMNSVKNIRMILIAKSNEMPSFKIRNRLLQPY